MKNIAKFFEIPEWEFQTNDKLYEILKSRKDTDSKFIFKLLSEYFSAYDEWFSFYQKRQKIEKTNGIVYITKGDELKLDKLIKERENTLNRLQSKFDELQVKKFNIKSFGKDIPGIIYH